MNTNRLFDVVSIAANLSGYSNVTDYYEVTRCYAPDQLFIGPDGTAHLSAGKNLYPDINAGEIAFVAFTEGPTWFQLTAAGMKRHGVGSVSYEPRGWIPKSGDALRRANRAHAMELLNIVDSDQPSTSAEDRKSVDFDINVICPTIESVIDQLKKLPGKGSISKHSQMPTVVQAIEALYPGRRAILRFSLEAQQ